MSKTIVIVGLFLVGLVASTVNATVIMYEMSVMPDAEAVSPMLVGGAAQATPARACWAMGRLVSRIRALPATRATS